MKFLPLIVLIFSFSAKAERLTSKIHSVDYASEPNQPHLIQFENGRVGFLSSLDKSSVLSLEESRRRGEWLDVELDGKGNFLGAGVVAPPEMPLGKNNDPAPEAAITFDPTNLGTMAEATSIFRRMRSRTDGKSQCYNRAHIWAYEEYLRSGLKSVKLFMFFTRSYIRKYRYKWWFHVTPMTYVNGAAVAMDRSFMRKPVSVKAWTDNFIYSKRECPVVHKYSDYRNNQETEHCYLIPTSMYYWQPRDIEKYENTGFYKTQFIKSEVNWAYDEAF